MLNGSFTVYGLRLVNTFSSVTNNPLTLPGRVKLATEDWGRLSLKPSTWSSKYCSNFRMNLMFRSNAARTSGHVGYVTRSSRSNKFTLKAQGENVE